jgi:glycosyltransferase involved in cell wall biosynthesis
MNDTVKKKIKKKSRGGAWQKLYKEPDQFSAYDFPKVSIIIPSYNASSTITETLDSVLEQNYPDYEVLVVDGGSTDRTLSLVRSYNSKKVHLYFVYENFLYEMLNKGIALAQGLYVNFLHPGATYLQKDSLSYMMSLAIDHGMPHMVFGGALLHSQEESSNVYFRSFGVKSLKEGHQPTILDACWFRLDQMYQLHGFENRYHYRGGFDLLCRFIAEKKFEAVSTSRVVSNFEIRSFSRHRLFLHFWETMQIIYRYFGVFTVLRWLFRQKDTRRLVTSWVKSLRVSFLGS